MAVVTDFGWEGRGFGILETFHTKDEAFQYAIEFGILKIERPRLMTLCC